MRVELRAKPGKIWTNGTTYGLDITLEEGLTAEDYREIDYSEYEEITNKERMKQMEGALNDFNI